MIRASEASLDAPYSEIGLVGWVSGGWDDVCVAVDGGGGREDYGMGVAFPQFF